MAEKTDIVVSLVLDNQLTAELQKANKAASGEAAKISNSIKSVGKTAEGEAAAGVKKFGTVNKETLEKAGRGFAELSGNVKALGNSAIQGDLIGAIGNFARIAVAASASVSRAMIAASGGILLVTGYIAKVISDANEANEKLGQATEKAIDAQAEANKLLLSLEADKTKKINNEARKKSDEAIAILRKERDVSIALREAEYNAKKISLVKFESEKFNLQTEFEDKVWKARNEIEKAAQQEIAQLNKDSAERATRADEIAAEKSLASDRAWNEARARSLKQYYDSKKQFATESAEADRKYFEDVNKQNQIDKEAKEKLAEAEKKAHENRVAQGREAVNSLFALATQVKELRNLYKAAAISETIIDTYVGAQKAFNALVGIPVVGPILGGAAAAAAVGAGMARVAMIKAQKFAQGGEFVTNGERTITVGDNPGGRELVQITPLSSQNFRGPQAGASINMGNIYITGNADAGTVKSINESRERQLRNTRRLLMELGYARQIPVMA